MQLVETMAERRDALYAVDGRQFALQRSALIEAIEPDGAIGIEQGIKAFVVIATCHHQYAPQERVEGGGRHQQSILRESYRPPEKPHGTQSAAPEVT